jgi:ApaG protein
MGSVDDNRISVNVDTRYLEDQSDPGESRYVFAYTITIRNRGTVPAKLLGRHWVITDANGKVQEVRGEGVVGEQPHLMPGQGFRYTSGAVLETPVGSMQGSYLMLADDGERFEAPIPAFSLAIPGTIH